MAETHPRKPGETVFGYLMLLLSALALWQAYSISGFSKLSSPGAFPMTAATVMLIASLLVILNDRKRPQSQHDLSAFLELILPNKVILLLVMVLAFSLLITPLGFIPTTFLFLVTAMYFLGHLSLARTLLLSFLILAVVYLVFNVIFKVVLPAGIVPEAEIKAWLSHLFSGGQ